MVRRAVKRAVARYSVLVAGLGAAGVAIGWLCHGLPAAARARAAWPVPRRLRGRTRPAPPGPPD